MGLRVALLCNPGGLGSLVSRTLRTFRADIEIICEPTSSIRYSRNCSRVLLCKSNVFADPGGICDAINRSHARRPIDIVMATDISGLGVLASTQSGLVPPIFPMPDTATLANIGHKWKFTTLCMASEIPAPKSVFFESSSLLDLTAVQAIGYPCVVKAIGEAGGDGIHVANHPNDILKWINKERALYERGMLVQEYIEGPDVGICFFAERGQIKNWATYKAQGRLSTKFMEIPELLDNSRRIIEATNFTGVANIDARLDNHSNQVKLFECNPRFTRRIREIEQCGLNLIEAGLHTMGLAARQPDHLVEGQHLSLRDVFTMHSVRAVLCNEYKLSMIATDIAELLSDPLPRVAPPINRFLTGRKTVMAS